MNINPRQSQIIMLVQQHGVISVEALAQHLGVTLQTVRRDIGRLAEMSLLDRFHGGARMRGSATENIAYRQRQRMQEKSKTDIAKAVAARVPNGCSILINIGTTTEAIAHELLSHRDLKIITNNLHIAALLSTNPSFEVIIAGGLVRSNDQAVVGEATVGFINQFTVDLGILGVSSIGADGILRDYDFREVKVSQAIIKNSREVWMAADHSKFDRPAIVELGNLMELDVLFTDQPPPADFLEMMEKTKVECVIASDNKTTT